MNEFEHHVEWIRENAAEHSNNAIDLQSNRPEIHLANDASIANSVIKDWERTIRHWRKYSARGKAAADHLEHLQQENERLRMLLTRRQKELEAAKKLKSEVIFKNGTINLLSRAIEDAIEDPDYTWPEEITRKLRIALEATK